LRFAAKVSSEAASNYRADYESVFGALADLSAAPARAKPGDDV
jgi:hypothetical protein